MREISLVSIQTSKPSRCSFQLIIAVFLFRYSFWLLPFEQHKFSFSKMIVLHNKFTRVTFTSFFLKKDSFLFGIALITMELSLVLHAFFVFHMCCPILVATCDTITLKGSIESSQFPSNFLFGTASSSYQVFLPLSHFSQN